MAAQPEITLSRTEDHGAVLTLTGDWGLGNRLPEADDFMRRIEGGERIERLSFDMTGLGSWNSGLLIFLTKLLDLCDRANITAAREDLPQGLRKLLDLSSAGRQRKGIGRKSERKNFLVRVADISIDFMHSAREMLTFIGEAAIGFSRLLSGRAAFRGSDLLAIIQDTGPQSLPIVSLISVLVGLILAFVAAIQLRLFGAQIYVADVVGIGMVRVMGAIMTGIIMAGRTGASFAAELGTMQVNEEIDALKTSGISPMEFLVLPRMAALVLMMPLLCLYADLMGLFGGMFVGVTMLDIGVLEYYNQTKAALSLTHLSIGLFHSAVFGVLVAMSGCLRGMQCGRSASAVGNATTSAVVTGIVSIVVATAVITFGCEVLGI